MPAASSDPMLDALVAASASLRLQSPLFAPLLPYLPVGLGVGGIALSELEGTTSSKLYGVSDDIDCSNVKICFGLIGGNSGICILAMRRWRRSVTLSFFEYLKREYGSDWVSTLSARDPQSVAHRGLSGAKRPFGHAFAPPPALRRGVREQVFRIVH